MLLEREQKMLDIIKAIIYGIVEGITEWLPVSSTGHMILLNEFVKLDVSEEFFSMFLVVIQLGAILAVIILFWNKLWPFAMPKNNPDPVKKNGILSVCIASRWKLWIRILIACIPAAIIGILFDDILDELFYNPTCVAIMLIFAAAYGFLAVLNLYRLLKGPTAADRMVAGDSMDVLVCCALVLYAMYSGRGIYLDIAIIGAMLGIVDTMLVGRFLEKGGKK